MNLNLFEGLGLNFRYLEATTLIKISSLQEGRRLSEMEIRSFLEDLDLTYRNYAASPESVRYAFDNSIEGVMYLSGCSELTSIEPREWDSIISGMHDIQFARQVSCLVSEDILIDTHRFAESHSPQR